MKTWEETIRKIRSDPQYDDLVKFAYLEENLTLNIERFEDSEEFGETLKIIQTYQPEATRILDVGCGNGVSCISFARQGYKVTAVEPDPSETIGAGAIIKLKQYYNIDNLTIYESTAEELELQKNSFDIVYIRQAMHHANDLNNFIANCIRFLKPGGLLLTTRDHVIYNEQDKVLFLESHPLHRFYGGENAYTEAEYSNAIKNAGAELKQILRYHDSIINYAPMTKQQHESLPQRKEKDLINHLIDKTGCFGKSKILQFLYKKYIGFDVTSVYDESITPGRLYTFIAIKS